MTEHRAGINPGFLAKHRLSLAGLNSANRWALIAEIEEQPWVDRVWLDKRAQSLRITYDASHHNIDAIIAIVEKHGAAVNNNWWSRTRLGWQRQTDENIMENAKLEAFCCSKMPPGYGGKSRH